MAETHPAYDLNDAEKHDLTQLIQAGKPLPEKYRFNLFEDQREVELVWNGKSQPQTPHRRYDTVRATARGIRPQVPGVNLRVFAEVVSRKNLRGGARSVR
jgi:hypothetical protein